IMIMLSVIAIIVSISSYMLFVKLIAPFFENNLFKMNINKTIPKKKKSFILFSKFFSKFNFGIFYNFANKMLSSDRKLKMTIYPTLAIALFFPIMFFYQSLKENGENLKNTPLYFMLYLLSMFTIQIYVIVYHSQHYQASWLFRYLPIKSPKPIFQGTLLAIFFKFQFPLLVLSSLFVLKFWGIKLLPEIFVIILNSIIIVFLFNIMGERILPFSRKFVGNRALSYRGTSYLLVSVVFFPIVGGIHYAFTLFSGGIFILILIQIFAIVMLWRGFFNSLNWLEIKE
ncbi:MAG: hypothetical protein U9N34_01015, partial [Candidatus Cloacimonadota bacterium]|nr:hypothetical protein [Candidatus Cloacimonadota bacterium]